MKGQSVKEEEKNDVTIGDGDVTFDDVINDVL